MPRFFIDASKILNDEALLDTEETRHAVSVFRVKRGDALDLFDGKGRRFSAVAKDVADGKLVVRITGSAVSPFPSAAQVTLGVAVFRPERMEVLIQKACELGAHAIIPLMTDRAIVKLSADRWVSKIKRWQKIIQESCKQCGLAYAPEIAEPVSYKDFLPKIKNYDAVFIPTLEGTVVPLAQALPRETPRRILALVGPEGDFSPKEISLALACGAKPVSLGPLVLRSETAGIYILSVIHFFYREINQPSGGGPC